MTWPRFRELLTTYLFILPAIVLFTLFSLFPFIKVFQLSVFEWDGFSNDMKFVWLNNFRTGLFHDASWWVSMRNAGVITVLAMTVQNGLALATPHYEHTASGEEAGKTCRWE